MRIGQTLNLKIENILIDKKAIVTTMEINKGRKDRYIFFSITMQQQLRRLIDYSIDVLMIGIYLYQVKEIFKY